jgi:hypothetical protein
MGSGWEENGGELCGCGAQMLCCAGEWLVLSGEPCFYGERKRK